MRILTCRTLGTTGFHVASELGSSEISPSPILLLLFTLSFALTWSFLGFDAGGGIASGLMIRNSDPLGLSASTDFSVETLENGALTLRYLVHRLLPIKPTSTVNFGKLLFVARFRRPLHLE